jgi:tyrosinase
MERWRRQQQQRLGRILSSRGKSESRRLTTCPCPDTRQEAIFLPWHRPYILLYEQLLVREAVAIASRYPGSHRDQYLAAAQRLRSPYWDWSANSDVPPCTIPARVTIKVPNGNGLEQVQVDNPLQTYQFPRQALAGQFGPFPQRPTRMVKCPGPGRYPDTPNQRLSARRLKQGTVSQ